MDELVLWLSEQLDEDERIARESGGGDWMLLTVPRFSSPGDRGEIEIGDALVTLPTPDVALHIAAHDPARVLREIDAKHQILQLHTPSDLGTWVGDDDDKQPACRTCGNLTVRFPCATLRLLALPYAGRVGYREEWRP